MRRPPPRHPSPHGPRSPGKDANALVALLIARDSDEHMVTQAEELFCYFGQIETQIGTMIETAQE